MGARGLIIRGLCGLFVTPGAVLPGAQGQCLDPQPVPGIVGASGQVIPIETPISLLDGATTCDVAAYVMLESTQIAAGTIVGDILDPGLYDADNPPSPIGLPTDGLLVDTYLLHFDTTGGQAIVEGSFTLDQDVIGILTSGNNLIATDGELGAPGRFYEGDPRREVEWDETPQGDPISYVALSADRRTVSFRLRVDGSFQDQLRVVAAPYYPACEHFFGQGGSYYIGPDDMTYEECRIIVDNCTLTIDGTHLFHSIYVKNNGVITHSAGYADGEFRGMELLVLDSVTVDLGSKMSASARGYAGDEGPGTGLAGSNYGGGGGHGGEGGRAGNGELSDGGVSYGSITEPEDFGSGGGQDVDNLYPGRRGGGAIRLDVGGTLTVNGFIEANGEGWQSNAASPGAGAGGSIWITAGSVAGTTGKIQAVGGHSLWSDGNDGYGGAGAGGRIAVYANSIALPEDNFDVWGGAGYSSGESGGDGAAGTVYLDVNGQRPKLVIDNDSVRSDVRVTMLPDGVAIPGDIFVRDRARLGVERGGQNVYWPITGDLTIEPGSDIWAAGRGYWADEGPGAGQWGFNWGGGGGHGGKGGDGRSDDPYALGGLPYGSELMPTTRGSGGATDPNTGAGSGSGGGALWIRVEGDLSLRGNIEAGGYNGGANEAGGGAGGSILIEAGSITGIATVRANGGAGNSVGGGGGGGRIAVYSCDVDPRIAFQVAGGSSGGGSAGEAGTLVQQGVAIGSQPQDVEADIGSDATFYAEALGVGLAMRWQKDGQPLSDGTTPHGSVISGSGTRQLSISNVQAQDFGAYRLEASNDCGQALSEAGMLSGDCKADFNNDGVVDSRDFVAFLNAWVAGDARADIDENGVVDSRDMIIYLNLWRAGC